jgi:hypothetical protein
MYFGELQSFLSAFDNASFRHLICLRNVSSLIIKYSPKEGTCPEWQVTLGVAKADGKDLLACLKKIGYGKKFKLKG